MAIAEVSVGGLVMSGAAPATWIVEKDGLGGWFDGPPVSATVVDHPGGHGTFATPGYRRGRVVTLQAVALAATVEAAGIRRREAAALLGDGTFSTLTVTEPDGHVTTAAVRIDAQPLVAWRPGWDYVRAQWQFYAPDPYRYGPAQQVQTGLPVPSGGLRFPLFTDGAGVTTGVLEFGPLSEVGTATMANPGSADAWPLVRADGPLPAGFSVVTPGVGKVTYAGAIPEGSYVEVDYAAGTAVMDGVVDRGTSLTWRQWAPVPPGGEVPYLFQAPSYSAGLLTVTVYPTYW